MLHLPCYTLPLTPFYVPMMNILLHFSCSVWQWRVTWCSSTSTARTKAATCDICAHTMSAAGDICIHASLLDDKRYSTEVGVLVGGGQVLETTRGEDDAPISFEIGAGELFANEMIKVATVMCNTVAIMLASPNG